MPYINTCLSALPRGFPRQSRGTDFIQLKMFEPGEPRSSPAQSVLSYALLSK